MEILKTTAAGVVLNYSLHFVSGYIYNYLCMPHDISQILNSFVTTASPVCSATVNILQASQQNYANIIMAAASVGIARSLISPSTQ